MSFRNSELLERKDDIMFNVENEFAVPDANAQNGPIVTVVIDRSTAIDALDLYDARLSFDFSLQLLANGGNMPNAQQGIVNGAHTFVRGTRVIIDGTTVYNNANGVLQATKMDLFARTHSKQNYTRTRWDIPHLDWNEQAETRLHLDDEPKQTKCSRPKSVPLWHVFNRCEQRKHREVPPWSWWCNNVPCHSIHATKRTNEGVPWRNEEWQNEKRDPR